jgi:hypothetical protein
LSEVRLLDGRIRPEPVHELLLLEEPAGVLDEQHQRIERLALEGDGLAVAHQQAAFRIDEKPIELVKTDRTRRTLSPAEKR